MDLLCFCSVLCLLCLCARLFHCALWSPAGKGLSSWLSFVVSNCPIGILGQVWYLIVSIPDLCTLSYFDDKNKTLSKLCDKTFWIRHMRIQRGGGAGGSGNPHKIH